jgi:hypothetical protein
MLTTSKPTFFSALKIVNESTGKTGHMFEHQLMKRAGRYIYKVPQLNLDRC